LISVKQSDRLSRTTRAWGLILMVFGIIFSPFYFFDSGLPQPVHAIMLISCVAIIGFNTTACLNHIKQNKRVLLFFLLTTIINLSYAAILRDGSFILSIAYWAYGFVLFIALIHTAPDRVIAEWVTKLILLALMVVVLAFLFGYGHSPYIMRYAYFFNAPNQLAYFAICMFTLYIGASRAQIDSRFCAVFTLTIFVVFSTGGRSGYFSVIPIFFIALWLARRNLKYFLAILITPFLVGFIFQSTCLPFYNVVNGSSTFVGFGAEVRTGSCSAVGRTISRTTDLGFDVNSSDNSSIWTQLKSRGYLRLIDHPEYLIYGAGQGMDSRFGQTNGESYEIHSSPIALLFYYGFFGLLLFINFLVNSFKSKANLILLLPIFIYSLFTYGLRAPYFWFALAFLSTSQSLLSAPQDPARTSKRR
jgi:hypothetical protein